MSNRENHKDITNMHTSKSQTAWAAVFCVALAAMGCTEGSKEAPPMPTTASPAAPQSRPMGVIGANLVTATARDPRNLERVAVGDLVEITYTQAVAVSVEKPRKP
jgi:hypothetical protein